MRASIYNAMPMEGVAKLVEMMKKFEAQIANNGGVFCVSD
jgi:phosphoserine aminotransferase